MLLSLPQLQVEAAMAAPMTASCSGYTRVVTITDTPAQVNYLHLHLHYKHVAQHVEKSTLLNLQTCSCGVENLHGEQVGKAAMTTMLEEMPEYVQTTTFLETELRSD